MARRPVRTTFVREPVVDPAPVVKRVEVEVSVESPVEPPVPRYSRDGVLLNPGDFLVTADGFLRPK